MLLLSMRSWVSKSSFSLEVAALRCASCMALFKHRHADAIAYRSVV